MIRRVAVYVELDVGMASEHGAAAWTFEPDLWGRCGQGVDEPAALAALVDELTQPVHLMVTERITGDERAFRRDHRPATAAERAATLEALAAARRETMALVAGSPPEVLDFDDPGRTLPAWASWRTLRQMAWHAADTESRYYLPRLGLPARPPEADLMAELAASARHVREAVGGLPADLVRAHGDETWTTTKVLRRLAWHERSELRVMRELARRPWSRRPAW